MQIQVNDHAIAEFCRRRAIRRLAFYGSVLSDRFTPGSDVDVLVEFHPEAGVTYFDIFEMEEELSGMLGGRRVELRTPQEISRHFRDQVLREAEEHFAAA